MTSDSELLITAEASCRNYLIWDELQLSGNAREIFVKSRSVSTYHRTAKYQRRGSREQLLSSEPWCNRGPAENSNDIRNLFVRRPLWSYVDVNLSVGVLILVGITANRGGSLLDLRSSPTVRCDNGRSVF